MMADGRHIDNQRNATSRGDTERSIKRIGRPPSWIFKNKKITADAFEIESRAPFCIIVPNFVDNGHIVASILRFFTTVFTEMLTFTGRSGLIRHNFVQIKDN